MMRKFIFGFFLLSAFTASAAPDPRALLEGAVVQIEITRKQYDFAQPWNRRVDQAEKAGVLVGPRQILTTAEAMNDLTLLRLQKGGRGKWFEGKLEWVDYHANLALVTSTNENFWKDLKAVKIADQAPRTGSAQVGRWRNGTFDLKSLEINRMVVKRGRLTNFDLLFMEVDSEVPATGRGEPMFKDGQLVGITSSKEERTATVIPSSFIKQCLEGRKDWRGLGYFAFVYQGSENPASIEHLKVPGEPRGVIVIEAPTNTVSEIQERDVIVEIEGFSIDQKGDYKDPQYGNLSLECISTRKHWAGDELKIKVWRGDKMHDVKYKLPRAEYTNEVVPDFVFNQEPDYMVVGGLIFQPLTGPYLQSWGADWQRRAPFKLSYLARKKATPEMPTAVVLSSILPDKFTLGYQDARYLIVDSMNGVKVRTLTDIVAARQRPQNGFHEITFQKGESLSRIILDASQLDGATKRVMERFGISEAERIQ